MKYHQYLFFICAALFCSCVKDKPKVAEIENTVVNATHRVFVLNEGNYSVGNAALTYYNPADNTVIEDYYRQQNNAPIGDVLQSMVKFENKFYLVVNNSNKIVVCDTALKKINQISGLTSPRYFLPLNSDKAYVSDLFANQIHIINLKTNTKTGSIACAGWTEQMQNHNGKVYVTNFNRDYLYVIDVLSDKLIDSVLVGTNASSIVKDKNNHLWVMCGADKSKSKLAQLTKVDATNNQILQQFIFTANDEPSQLCLNKTKDTLYFLNKGIYRMPIQQSALPASVFIAQNNRNFYGLGINHNDYTIYVSDALDYIQKSNCYIYNNKGEQLKLFKAGINAGAFYFE